MEAAHSDKQNLDEYLQWLAINEWQTFKRLVGDEAITSAKVCIMIKRGFSLQQISNRLQKTKEGVRWAKNRKCECN